MQISDYCREIETYLCQKNEGHLIRVVGPSFDLVAGWANVGIPLKVALHGIDRYFERYYRHGPRRRPVRIDFCDADVLDAFDAWRRALGLPATTGGGETAAEPDAASSPRDVERRGPSLPAHLGRVLTKLSTARAIGALDPVADALIDRVAEELHHVRESARGLRGETRRALIQRLVAIDRDLLSLVRGGLDDAARFSLEREAEQEIAGFRATMSSEAYQRAREAAVDRLLRERFSLPTISLT